MSPGAKVDDFSRLAVGQFGLLSSELEAQPVSFTWKPWPMIRHRQSWSTTIPLSKAVTRSKELKMWNNTLDTHKHLPILSWSQFASAEMRTSHRQTLTFAALTCNLGPSSLFSHIFLAKIQNHWPIVWKANRRAHLLPDTSIERVHWTACEKNVAWEARCEFTRFKPIGQRNWLAQKPIFSLPSSESWKGWWFRLSCRLAKTH